MSAMGVLSRRRRPPASPPMAVPLDDAQKPLGVRLAEGVRGLVTQRLSRSARRVLAWTCIALLVGVVAVGYLLQTSYVASLADMRGGLESTTVAVQDTNSRLTARAAEARALGRAEPVARSQGLRVAGPGNVAYLTAVDVPDPTAPPRAGATATPSTFARVGAALLGQGYADAPPAPPAGFAATATAVRAAASLEPASRRGTAAPFATPPLATLPPVPPTLPPSLSTAPPAAVGAPVITAPSGLGTVPPLSALPTPPRATAGAATVAARGASTVAAPAARGAMPVPTVANVSVPAARPPVIVTALPATPTTARAAGPAAPAAPVANTPAVAPPFAMSPAATLVTLQPAQVASASPASPTPAPMQPVTRASTTTTGGRP